MTVTIEIIEVKSQTPNLYRLAIHGNTGALSSFLIDELRAKTIIKNFQMKIVKDDISAFFPDTNRYQLP